MIGNNRHSPALWRYQIGSLSLIGIIAIASEIGILPVQAALLAKWRFDPTANQLEFTVQDGTTPRYFLLTQPPRIVLELPNTQMGKVVTTQNYSGVVREVRVAQFEENLTRIVLELSPEVILAPGMVQLEKVKPQGSGKGDRWLLRPLIAHTSPQTPKLPSTSGSIQQTTGVTSTNIQQGAINSGTSTTIPSTTLPPATFNSQQPDFVSVPPLSSPARGSEVSPNTPVSTPLSEPVIQFGEPLPMSPVTVTPRNSLPILQPDTPTLPEANSPNSITTETPQVVVPTVK